jgi:hypothetical protein
MKSNSLVRVLCLTASALLLSQAAAAQPPEAAAPAEAKGIALTYAVLCETIVDYSPLYPAVVFSIAMGKVSCFTSFDPVPEKSHVEHRWFFKDSLSAKKKLFVKNPRWSTYSSIQLREADKGPWRVEIVDDNDRILGILRFSVTD